MSHLAGMVRLPNLPGVEGSMGFWGTYIVARADQSMTDLPALVPSAGVIGWEGRIDWHGRGADGWQAVQISYGPEGWEEGPEPGAGWEGTLRALMEQSGHPVIATTIQDSDCGQLIGYSPEAGRWSGWLHLQSALGYWDDTVHRGDEGTILWDENGEMDARGEEITDEKRERYTRRRDAALARFLAFGADAEGATPLAVAWAREAGLQPDPAAVLATLKGMDTYAERQFFELLTALGLPDLTTAGT
jgi:hypothetical protein